MESFVAIALLAVAVSSGALVWALMRRNRRVAAPAAPHSYPRALAPPPSSARLLTREPPRAPSTPRTAPSAPRLAPTPARVPTFASLGEDDGEHEDITLVGRAPAAESIPRLSPDDDDETPAPQTSAMLVFERDAEQEVPTSQHDLVLLTAQGQTDVGHQRRRNEDSLLARHEDALYVVADGMGGYSGGDVASQTAVGAIEHAFARGEFPERDVDIPLGAPPLARELASAVGVANSAIFERSRAAPALAGMGTTVVGARFAPRKQRVYIANVGDSRCYRLRAGELRALTRDHTLAAMGVEGPLASRLRRAVGIDARVKVDLHVDKPRPGDVYVLCSDGLTKMIAEDRIKEVLLRRGDDLDAAVAELIDAANAEGGKDNTSVILVAVRSPSGGLRDSDRHAPDGSDSPSPRAVSLAS